MRIPKGLRLYDEVRKAHIQKVLQMCNGNRLRVAQILGMAAPVSTAI